MTINSENGGEDGGGCCRTSPSLLSETMMSGHGGVGDGRISEAGGGTKSTTITREEECNSSSSSSIGNNSDDDVDDREGDAQSPYRYDHHSNKEISNGSFEDAIHALEEALPIRRGISSFYNGKSKSFTSLANVCPSSTQSIQDIAKPENAYTRKRRNLLASNLSPSRNKNRAFQLSNISTGRISKKTKISTLRFTLEGADPNSDDHATQRPSLKQNLSSMRSFSMVNLHQCGSTFAFNST